MTKEELFDKGCENQDMGLIIKSADMNYAPAMKLLAQSNALGEEKSFELRKKLAYEPFNDGDSKACLGILYCEGKGVLRDCVKGLTLIVESLEKNGDLDYEVYSDIGNVFWSGNSTESGKSDDKSMLENEICIKFQQKYIEDMEKSEYRSPNHDKLVECTKEIIKCAEEQNDLNLRPQLNSNTQLAKIHQKIAELLKI